MNDIAEIKNPELTIEEECCPRFHPEKWEEQNHHWKEKRFVKTSIPTIFHMPLPSMIGNRVTKLVSAAEKVNGLNPDMEKNLLLFYDPHAFKSEMFLSVEKEIPDLKNVTISGRFISKVFDGPYREIPKFFKEMEGYLDSINKKADNYYVHYAYCPKCSRKYGHNYMVIFARIAE